MENFTYKIPTTLRFGTNVIDKLHKDISKYGKNILLIYGQGSIEKNGVLESVKKELALADVNIFIYKGIKSNPIILDINEAVKVGIKNNIDVILAVGGGSVIDSAKIVSLCIPEDFDAWEVLKYKVSPKKAIPVLAVLTIAATGTEMNQFAVAQNSKTKEKIGYAHPLIFPKISYLDPQYTFSVNARYTAYGVVDLIAHTLESFFGEGESSLSDKFVYAIIKDAIENSEILFSDLQNYEARANLMWQATNALNGLTAYGRKSQDWGLHDVGHTISFLFDTPHGATLSIAYPAWLKIMSAKIPKRIIELGKGVFNVNSVEETISSLEKFFRKINSPIRLSEIGIGADRKNEILELLVKNRVTGYYHKLDKNDYIVMLDLMM